MFQHLRRRIWSGERENRAHSSPSPISLFERRIQRRLPFLQRRSLKLKKKYCTTIFGYISQFHSKKWPIFRINSVRNWFRGNYGVSAKIKTPLLKKRQTSLDASRKKVSRTLGRAGLILPFPGSNTPAKVLKPLFSVFRISFIVRDGLNK